jgi:hypothetical protein
VLWSPDSKKVATFQQDERKVGDMYLVETKAGHPVLQQWKYPLPGDEAVAMLHRVIIDADSGATVRFKMDPDYHRATLGDNFSLTDMTWSPDATKLAFVSTSRDHKSAVLRVADAATGDVRTVFDETVATHYESRTGWRVLWATNEVIWYSQPTNRATSLRLRDGKLKTRSPRAKGWSPGHPRGREDAHGIFTAMRGARRTGPLLPHAYRIGLDARLRLAHAGGRRPTFSSRPGKPGRHLSTCENRP